MKNNKPKLTLTALEKRLCDKQTFVIPHIRVAPVFTAAVAVNVKTAKAATKVKEAIVDVGVSTDVAKNSIESMAQQLGMILSGHPTVIVPKPHAVIFNVSDLKPTINKPKEKESSDSATLYSPITVFGNTLIYEFPLTFAAHVEKVSGHALFDEKLTEKAMLKYPFLVSAVCAMPKDTVQIILEIHKCPESDKVTIAEFTSYLSNLCDWKFGSFHFLIVNGHLEIKETLLMSIADAEKAGPTVPPTNADAQSKFKHEKFTVDMAGDEAKVTIVSLKSPKKK